VEPRPVGPRRNGDRVRRASQDGPLNREARQGLSEQRKYRTFTAQQKLEIVLAGLRGDVSVKELCRQHEIAETLYYQWREKLLEGGREALAGKQERQGERELKRRIGQLERALGRKTYELEVAGEALRGWE
jgi:transposase